MLEQRAKYLSAIEIVMAKGIIALKAAVNVKFRISNFRQTPTELNKRTVLADAENNLVEEGPKCAGTRVICRWQWNCQLAGRRKK